ncbi:MAG: HNH endonuclease [Hyphomicrobiales bacterium]
MHRCLDCGAVTKAASRCRVCSRLRRLPRDRRNTAARGGSGWAWQRTRREVVERDGHRCVACGTTGVRFEVDHIVPLACGGSNEPQNLRTLCVTCHRNRRGGRGR